MKRMMLALPVWVVGLPLLLGLIWAAPRPDGEGKAVVDLPAPAPVTDGELPDAAVMEELARTDPVAFLENCYRRYERDVQGYRLEMQKQEFAGGKLQGKELIAVCFREKPFSVYFRWIEGARKAERALFVEGENVNKQGKSLLLARPVGAFARRLVGDVVEREVDGDDARQSGRYTMNKYGLKNGTLRTLAAWKAARDADALHTEYLGARNIQELEERTCWVLRRSNDQPEYDGVMEVTLFVDKETWLQTGSIVKGKGGQLIGEYYFRKIELNPQFTADQFQRSVLIPK